MGGARTRRERLGAGIFGLLLGHLRAARVRRHAGPQPRLPGRLPDRHGGVRARPHGGRRLRRASPRCSRSWCRSSTRPTDVSTAAQIVGAVGRGAVYFGLALLVSSLLERETQLRFSLAESERERDELESLRAALTAPELPARRRPPDRHLLHAGRRAGGGRLLPRHPRRGEQHAGRGRRRRRPRPDRGAPRVVRARDDRAVRRVRRRPDDDPAPGQHGAGRARPGHRVRDRAVRELRPRPRHRDVGERRPSAAVGPRPRRAAGQRAPLPAAGDRADARGDLRDDRAAPRRRRPALHRRAARGAHRARGASATTSSASRPRATRCSRCRARRRPTSSPGCARRRCDHAEGRPADDLCLVAVRLGAGERRRSADRPRRR